MTCPERLFHTTDAADDILADGFRDAEGSYGFVGLTLRGVFLASRPANVMYGATGGQVLEVLMPDDVDMTLYAIVEEDLPVWEWIVPAELINRRARARLLTDDEVRDASCQARWPLPLAWCNAISRSATMSARTARPGEAPGCAGRWAARRQRQEMRPALPTSPSARHTR